MMSSGGSREARSWPIISTSKNALGNNEDEDA
jgi:hypothetical protein